MTKVKRKRVRRGKAYYKGDRTRRGRWSKKRWKRAVKSDRKRRAKKRYEFWEA